MTITDDKRAAVRAALKRERARVVRVLAGYRDLYRRRAGLGDPRASSGMALCDDLILVFGGPGAVARVKRREARRG
ncbi:MAG TPA: hypothetical protein VD931_16390 [Baekduia sp.]|nr:hypothetical protein [Baekduia sp.]